MPEFDCNVCGTRLSVDRSLQNKEVRCPTCRAVQIAPSQPGGSAKPVTAVMSKAAASGSGAAATWFGSLPAPGGRRYGFACPYCSSPLEATDSMAAHQGKCPTCGNSITIPILDRYHRLIDPITQQIIKQDPHPVHAYAAAGDRAPKIVRSSNGAQQIECPRCGLACAVTSNNCRGCGMPFTMEGAATDATVASNGYCIAALVLGILSLPMFQLVVVGAVAIVCGVIGLRQTASGSAGAGAGRGMAIAGICLGGIGLAGGFIHIF